MSTGAPWWRRRSTVTWTAPSELVSDGADGATGATGATGPAGSDGSDGTDGEDAINTALTNPAHVVNAAADGTGYSLGSAGGTHQVTDGDTDVTASATHSVVAPATVNGLTMSVTSAGVYSLSGGSWTGDSATFTLRAVFGGLTFDKTYTIAKAKAGAAAQQRISAIGGNISDVVTVPDTAYAGYRISSDGKVYRNIGGGSWIEIGTWLLTGSASDYQVGLFSEDIQQGSGASGAAVGSWLSASSNRDWNVEATNAGNSDIVTYVPRWRDSVTLEVLGETSLRLEATADV